MSFHGGHIGWSCCAGQHEELGEADTTAGLLLEAGGLFAWGQVAAEDVAGHSGRWKEVFCISPF